MGKQSVYLIRHGETEWSLSGRHTSVTDLPLTSNGRVQAQTLKRMINSKAFVKIYCSPLLRARQTCEVLGYDQEAYIDDDLVEWRYGDYEGLTTMEIRQKVAGWSVFTDICPKGESVSDVTLRADDMLRKIKEDEGDVALISSGHILRVIAARWLGQVGDFGRFLTLDTASLSVLSYERDIPVIKMWNAHNLNPGA